MKFEVINRDGIVVFNTEYKECIPFSQELKDMESGGYKFRIDGRAVKASKITISLDSNRFEEINHEKQSRQAQSVSIAKAPDTKPKKQSAKTKPTKRKLF